MKPPKTTPKPPKHLRAATRRWWSSVVSEYVLGDHHVRLLTLAAEAWDRCVQAREALSKHGLTFEGFHGEPKARPEVAVERDSRLSFAKLLRELGLDLEPPAESRPAAIQPRHLRVTGA